MKPYYEDDFVTLYHGDCRELTGWLEADVLVTDPPYGRAWRQGGGLRGNASRSSSGAKSRAHGGIANDDTTAVRDAALAQWGDRPSIVFGDLTLPPPVGTRQTLAYLKPPDAGVRGAFAGVRRDLEAVYLVGAWRAGIGGRSSLLRTASACVGGPGGAAARFKHPHAKPIDLMCDLLSLAPGVIADPFAGSASTLFAAKLTGRRAVGVELDEAYCELAAERLAQDTLFGATG